MASIFDWSKTAGNNDTADSGINWQENQPPSTVNNSSRQVMGRIAEYRDDIGGALVSTNIGNAYSVTANSAFSSLTNGCMLSFRANANNTGATTLAVNGLGAKAVSYNSLTGEAALIANMIRSGCVYVVRYSTVANAGAGAWMLQNPSLALAAFSDFTPVQQSGGAGQGANKIYIGWNGTNALKAQIDGMDHGVISFPAGTRMVFAQASAPPGWVQDVTVNDRVLTVTSGVGNADGGSWTISGLTVGGTAITVEQLPSHTHSNTLTDFGHTHGINDATNLRAARNTGAFVSGGGNVDVTIVSPSIVPALSNIAINNASVGSGATHTHSTSHDSSWRPLYRSTIICAKS